jgi:hypothetical protein
MACLSSRISHCQLTDALMHVRIVHAIRDSMLGLEYSVLGGSMRKPTILSAFLVLMPATILLTSHASIAEPTVDECRMKPGASAPPGLHWYYRVDRTNNRHCWYLHAQGMQTHSLTNGTSRDPALQDEHASEPPTQGSSPSATVQAAPAERTATPRTGSETLVPDASVGEYPGLDFAARWIDLPKSIDLNTRERVAGSTGYAPEREATTAEQLPSSFSIVSGEDDAARLSSTDGPKLGSISLTGAAVLVLLLLSEGLVRLVRMSAAKAWRRPIRARLHGIGGSSLARAASGQPGRRAAPSGDARRPETGLSELRRVLRRADAGLRPSRSFAPSPSIINHVRAKSAFQRLKTRSFRPRWAPL